METTVKNYWKEFLQQLLSLFLSQFFFYLPLIVGAVIAIRIFNYSNGLLSLITLLIVMIFYVLWTLIFYGKINEFLADKIN
ncbi:hypothetical protein ACFL0A_01605 [Patescibacteria group bacterium]